MPMLYHPMVFHSRPSSTVHPFFELLNSLENEHAALTEVKKDGNDNEKFVVNLDVNGYKPEELKIDLDGRQLKIGGHQEVKNADGYSKKSFTRIVTIPDNIDLAAIESNLTKEGQLSIEGPLKAAETTGRSIPIRQQAIQQ